MAKIKPKISRKAKAAKNYTGGQDVQIRLPDGSIETVNTASPLYAQMYDANQIQSTLGTEAEPINLQEVTVRPPKGFWEQSYDKFQQDNKDSEFIGAMLSPFTYALSVPQQAMMYGATGKVQDPSEALGIENPYLAFAANAILDPANIVGAGLASKGRVLPFLNNLVNPLAGMNFRKGAAKQLPGSGNVGNYQNILNKGLDIHDIRLKYHNNMILDFDEVDMLNKFGKGTKKNYERALTHDIAGKMHVDDAKPIINENTSKSKIVDMMMGTEQSKVAIPDKNVKPFEINEGINPTASKQEQNIIKPPKFEIPSFHSDPYQRTSTSRAADKWLEDWFYNPETKQKFLDYGGTESEWQEVLNSLENPIKSNYTWGKNQPGGVYIKLFDQASIPLDATVDIGVHEGIHKAKLLLDNKNPILHRLWNDFTDAVRLTPSEAYPEIFRFRQKLGLKPGQTIDLKTMENNLHLISDGYSLPYKIKDKNKLLEIINKAPAVFPYVGAGYLGYEGLQKAGAMQEKKNGGSVWEIVDDIKQEGGNIPIDPMGYWNPDNYDEPAVTIPSNEITMQGIDYPIYGEDNTGYAQMMYPGEDYIFPGDYVTEYPLPEAGGGYRVIRSNERKGKTHKVIGPGGKVKFFGDSKLGQHPKDPARKKAFYARHKKNLAGNPYFRAFARKTWEEGGLLDFAQEGLSVADKIQLGLDAAQFVPGLGQAAYIASLPFTTYDVAKDIQQGNWKQAGKDALGYIPAFKAFKYGMKGEKFLDTTSKLAKQLAKANIAVNTTNLAVDAKKKKEGGMLPDLAAMAFGGLPKAQTSINPGLLNKTKEYSDYQEYLKAKQAYDDSLYIANQERRYNEELNRLKNKYPFNIFKRGEELDKFEQSSEFQKNIMLQERLGITLPQTQEYIYTDNGKEYYSNFPNPSTEPILVKPPVVQLPQPVNTSKPIPKPKPEVTSSPDTLEFFKYSKMVNGKRVPITKEEFDKISAGATKTGSRKINLQGKVLKVVEKQAFGGLHKAQDGFYNMQRALELGYNPDDQGHWPSVDSETGMWLKSKEHPTAWMEYLYGYALNPEVQKNFKHPVVNPEGYFGKNQLQYIPKQAFGGNLILEKYQGGGSKRKKKKQNIAETPTVDMYGRPIESRFMVNPNVERSYYDPRRDAIFMQKDYNQLDPYDKEKMLAHENYHAYQFKNDRSTYLPVRDIPYQRPPMVATDEYYYGYHNRKPIESQIDIDRFKEKNPSFRFVSDDAIFNYIVDPEQYLNPETFEGEAKFYEDLGVEVDNPAFAKKLGGSIKKANKKTDWEIIPDTEWEII